jgi:hypothetical protein
MKAMKKGWMVRLGWVSVLTILALSTSVGFAAFQKGDWVYVTPAGNGLQVYNDDLTQYDPRKNRRSEQGGGILDGPHKSDSRFWKIRWDDRVEGWSADKKRDGTEIWLDLFASMLSLMLALLTR